MLFWEEEDWFKAPARYEMHRVPEQPVPSSRSSCFNLIHHTVPAAHAGGRSHSLGPAITYQPNFALPFMHAYDCSHNRKPVNTAVFGTPLLMV